MDEPALPPIPDATIGAFRIVRELGAGGMGRVFEAHDPALDRRVAIKVVRDPGAGAAARDRMLREAQAMARLAHPNVITIHEVETRGDEVFLVMELVGGETVASWMLSRRPWRAIVEVFVQAGAGLAAAHAAGIVHRDFKPHNVMIDDAGRVRVGDFGLARTGTGAPIAAAGSGDPDLARGSELAGTPAYAAPEQRAGREVDARADQYAFAFSLEQALGNAADRVPRRVRAAIARAMAEDPDARFATLDALLGELRGALARRRRVAIAGALAVAIAGGAAATLAVRPAAAPACDAGAALIDDVWTPGARGELAAALGRARAPAASIASVTRTLDDWTAAWRLGRSSACAAPSAERAARLACLDRDLIELRAQLAVWLAADGRVGERAASAAAALPDVAACLGARGDRIELPPLTAELARLRALVRSGRVAVVGDQPGPLLKTAEALGDPGALAEALIVAAEIEHERGHLAVARDDLARAARAAGTAGDQALMTQALVGASHLVVEQGRPIDAFGLLDAADALAAAGHYDRLDRLALARGKALSEAGRVDEAIPQLERAIALYEARAARDHGARRELAQALVWLASAHSNAYRYAQALPLAERALAIEEADLGPNHPAVAETLHTISNLQNRLRRFDDAERTCTRARSIFVTAYGEQHETVGVADYQLASIALLRGQPEVARARYQRALRELAGLPPDHPTIAAIETGLGSIERDLDRCAEALPHFERAIAIFEKLGRGGTELAGQLVNRGACLLYTDQLAEAGKSLARAEALFETVKIALRDRSELYMLQAELADKTGDRPRAIALARKVADGIVDGDGEPYLSVRQYARETLEEWRAR